MISYQRKFSGDARSFGRVAVLYGGESSEREISVQSGRAIMDTLRAQGVEVVAVDVGKAPLNPLLASGCERAFIALHGGMGEDGRIQALLDSLSIPYTGSDFSASALAINKLTTKALWQSVALPTAEFVVLQADTVWEQALAALGGQCVVKPVREGSSLGMRCVHTAADLQQAYAFAAGFDRSVIAERKIIGKELTVGILNHQSLPVIELRHQGTFFDYQAKYVATDTEYFCPTSLSANEEHSLRQLALRAFTILGCHGWGRVDFMWDEAGQAYLLEVNTVPGMTAHSLLPMAAKAAGLSFAELLLEVLAQTL